MSPDDAARLLASAWRVVVGEPLGPEGLAVLWAHWAFETGRGRHMFGYNFAGLKGEAPDGGSAQLWTRETQGKVQVRVRRTFRVYRTARQGAEDYVRLLVSRYRRAARAVQRGSVVDFVTVLEERGYFTDVGEKYRRALASLASEARSLRGTIAQGS